MWPRDSTLWPGSRVGVPELRLEKLSRGDETACILDGRLVVARQWRVGRAGLGPCGKGACRGARGEDKQTGQVAERGHFENPFEKPVDNDAAWLVWIQTNLGQAMDGRRWLFL